VTLGGIAVETGEATGLAIEVAPWIGGRLEPTQPRFWVGWMAAWTGIEQPPNNL
jgi:hypothetical protein